MCLVINFEFTLCTIKNIYVSIFCIFAAYLLVLNSKGLLSTRNSVKLKYFEWD